MTADPTNAVPEPQQLKSVLQHVLQHVPSERVQPLMDALAEETIEVVDPPSTGLVMMSARDCYECDFYLGEVLITQAEVKYDGTRGHGRIPGNQPEKALLLATTEAIVRSGNDSLARRLGRLTRPLRREVDEKLDREARLAASTRVSFDSMAEE
jgi:phosphonate C-P lyase system protein PhnG